jgi:hypothetical protein
VVAFGQPMTFEEVVPHDDGPHAYVTIKFPVKDAAGTMVELGTGGSGGSGSVDVYSYATPASFPSTGSSAVIYIATDTSRAYQWAGTAYIELGSVGGAGSAISASVTIPAVGDQYWNSTGLLLRGDGVNDGTVFTDSGPLNKSITRIGSTVTSTAQSKFGGASIYMDGNNTGLEIGSAFDETLGGFGTGDFTVEMWFRSSMTARGTLFSAYRPISPPTGFALQINRDLGGGPAFGSVGFGYGDESLLNTAGGVWSANTWHHLAVVRSGTTMSIFIDGISRASATITTNFSDGDIATIGCIKFFSNNAILLTYAGYVDDFRITKAARYTANFTPPPATYITGAYTAPVTLPVTVTGTSSGLTWAGVPSSATATGTAGQIAYDGDYLYVAVGSNQWERAAVSWDDSFSSVASLLQFDLAFPVDAAGNTWTTSGSPTMSRAGGKFGGAIVFPDSPASYITTARTSELEIGSSDFTLEWWLRPTAYPAGSSPQFNSLLYSTRGTSALAGFIAVMNPAGKLATFISSNTSSWDISSGTLFTTSAIPLNQWTHVALTRSGTTYRGFFNGALEVTATLSGTPSVGSGGVFIGGDTGGERFVGSMDDFRFTKSCRYTASFTAPTAALANR